MNIHGAIETLIENEVVDYHEIRSIITAARRKDLLKPYEVDDLVEQAKRMSSCEGW